LFYGINKEKLFLQLNRKDLLLSRKVVSAKCIFFRQSFMAIFPSHIISFADI